MHLSSNGYQLIRTFEGVRNKAYRDSKGIWTIGIGFTRINGKSVSSSMTMTDIQIEVEFLKQIIPFENYVNDMVKRTLNQNQFDSLVSLCYNIGPGNLKKSTLLKKINNNPLDPSIRAEFVKYDRSGGKVIQGLLNRRLKESQLYFS